jgi:hypothetical protein
MKSTKPIYLCTIGFLSALLLAGCFNPLEVEPPQPGAGLSEPFTLEVMIGKDGQARSVAGPSADRIKGDIRNVIQLVVLDKATKRITAFDEVRRETDGSDPAVLAIESLPFGKEYCFLLLMGHWERDYAQEAASGDGKYVYKEGEPPTLMAAGLSEQLITGSGKVKVTMWPLVVDAVFETAEAGVPAGLRVREAAVNAGKPGKAALLPVEWKARWTVKRGSSGNGFENLIKAQKALDGNAGDELLVKGKGSVLRGSGLQDAVAEKPVVQGNVITLGLDSAYTKGMERIEAEGSVNFKLEYVPYNLTDGAQWTGYKGVSAFDLDGKAPVWMIRNGVNDLAQDGKTDFANLGKQGHSDANGNGAIGYKVSAAQGSGDKEFPGYTDLTLTKGEFKGPADSAAPKITFTTGGYSGTAEGRYAVTGQQEPEPVYSGYTGSFGGLGAGAHEEEAALPTAGGSYYIYVVLFKDGNVSSRIRYDSATGDVDLELEWGDDKAGGGNLKRFVAIAWVDDKAAWSEDGGETWKAATLPSTANWTEVAYGNGRFLAVAGNSNKAALSEDGGETWKVVSMPATSRWTSAAYGNGRFAAVGGNDNTAAWSEDGGETWKKTTMPSLANWLAVAYGNGRFLTFADGNNTAALSEDGGETWKMAAVPSAADWQGVAYGNGRFAAVAYSSNKAAWSEDGGGTWKAATLPSNAKWYSAAYGNGRFAVVAYSSDQAAWSEDGGETWKTAAMPANAYWISVAAGE